MVNKRIAMINANYSLTINCIIKLRHLLGGKKRPSHAALVRIARNETAVYQMQNR